MSLFYLKSNHYNPLMIVRHYIFIISLLFSFNVLAQELTFNALTQTDWQTIELAKGVSIGNKGKANIQVIFDVNCPHSAQLFTYLLSQYPNTNIRWVPIAYFRLNSASLAHAILRSQKPQIALKDNFNYYDFENQQGGFQTSVESLPNSINKSLKASWKAWIGGTPLIVVRTANNQILMHAGSNNLTAIKQIILLADGLKDY